MTNYDLVMQRMTLEQMAELRLNYDAHYERYTGEYEEIWYGDFNSSYANYYDALDEEVKWLKEQV